MSQVGMEHVVIWPLVGSDPEAAHKAADVVTMHLNGALGDKALRIMDDALRLDLPPSLFPESDMHFATALGKVGAQALKNTSGFSGGEGYKVQPMPPKD